MKTLHELHLEHNEQICGEFDDFVYDYFVKYCEDRKKEYQKLYDDYSMHDTKIRTLRDQIKSRDYDLFHTTAELQQLLDWIKSDSVYTLLRYGSKSTTIVDGMDDFYIDMLNLSEQLRSADREDIQNRNDAFDQQLP